MTDLVNVTVANGAYSMRQIDTHRWEILHHGRPWPAFEGKWPDNLHISLAYAVDELTDKVEGLSADLDAAVEVAFHRGAIDWVRLNYPQHFERLTFKKTDLP
jgi:hypothetical protein